MIKFLEKNTFLYYYTKFEISNIMLTDFSFRELGILFPLPMEKQDLKNHAE